MLIKGTRGMKDPGRTLLATEVRGKEGRLPLSLGRSGGLLAEGLVQVMKAQRTRSPFQEVVWPDSAATKRRG
jgi:hypothetical protein